MFIFMQIANTCRYCLYFKGFYDVYLEMYYVLVLRGQILRKKLTFLENDDFIFLILQNSKDP